MQPSEPPQPANPQKKRRDRGVIMVYVVALVTIISLITASLAQWLLQTSYIQQGFGDDEVQVAEVTDCQRLLNLYVRKTLLNNEGSVLDLGAMQNVLTNQLTPRLDYPDQKLFALSSLSWSTNIPPGATINPDAADWFDPSNTMVINTWPMGASPMCRFWQCPHSFQLDFSLFGPLITTNVLNQSSTNYLPTTQGTQLIQIREVPSAQIPLMAIDKVNASSCTLPLDVKGTAFFPYGVDMSSNTGTPIIADQIVTPAMWNDTNSTIQANKKIFVRPYLTASWMMDPYYLTHPAGLKSAYNQAYATRVGVFNIQFDGETVNILGGDPSYGDPSPAISVGPRTNANVPVTRLIIQPAKFDRSYQLYVDCTTPQAKQRGILIVGARDTYTCPASIATDGAIFLEGEQRNGPLLLASHYGGIVFTDPNQVATNGTIPYWKACIEATVRPPTYSAFIDPMSITTTSFISLTDDQRNHDEVSLVGTVDATPATTITFGFTLNQNTTPDNSGVWLNLTKTGPTVKADLQVTCHNTRQTLATFTTSSLIFPVDFTYRRAKNQLTGNIDSQLYSINLNSYLTRFETDNFNYWSSPAAGLGTNTSIRLVSQKDGACFYQGDYVNQATLEGGLLFGQSVGGDLGMLHIIPMGTPFGGTPPTSPSSALVSFSDRFLLFDP